MEKVYGITERNDQFVVYKNGAVLTFGYGIEGEEGYGYCHSFTHVPTKEEVLGILLNHINTLTDEKILSGFVWNDIPVWLSTENQFNFKAAYDLAVQTNGTNLPIKFKLGEINNIPQYYVFDNVEMLADFYNKAIMFIMQALEDGWEEKDSATQWIESLNL